VDESSITGDRLPSSAKPVVIAPVSPADARALRSHCVRITASSGRFVSDRMIALVEGGHSATHADEIRAYTGALCFTLIFLIVVVRSGPWPGNAEQYMMGYWASPSR